ncbi:MAG: PDZ domain-containing protein [Pseudonocardia sp.]|nr:PDZ domain-containing protein [Pseudonocardia sp.]
MLVLLVGLIGATVPTPWVAIGPGPAPNVLGDSEGKPVITTNLPTYPTSGHLNMTTVQITDGLTLFKALEMWANPERQVVPRASLFPPDESQEEIDQKNDKDFTDSQTNAAAAALTYLKMPTRVFVGPQPPGLPANPALQTGDQILTVGGHPIDSVEDVRAALTGTQPGQQVTVRIQREDAGPQDVVVTLTQLAGSAQGALGIGPVAKPMTDDEITISLGGIGGPSAGLMFALAVVDKLTPGELTGGRNIAGTGEITSEGTVGPIGGIGLKLIGAHREGATVFLVPGQNCEEAKANPPDGLQLVRVDTLTDAVADLDLLRAGRTPPGC